MELRQVRYFVTIVDAGSFSRAAEVLHMTQPPLSMAVAKLERDTGAVLLDRTPQGVRPTPAGQYLYAQGRRILNDAHRIGESLAQLGRGESGVLRVAAGPVVMWDVVPPMLARLAQEARDVRIAVEDLPPGRLLAGLHAGEFDVGVLATADPVVLQRHHRDLHVHPITAMPMMLAVPATVDVSSPVALDDLVDATWMLTPEVPGFPGLWQIVDGFFTAHGFTPERTIEVTTPQTALTCVAAGMGVSVVPRSQGPTPAVRFVDLSDGALAPMQAVALWQRDRPHTPAVQRFVTLVRDVADAQDSRGEPACGEAAAV